MSKISKSILEKIDKEKIKPRPKWQFILLHMLLWSVFVITIILGGIAMSMAMFVIFNTEWAILPRIPGGALKGFLRLLPFIWIGLLVLTVYISSKIFEKTKKGYKHKPYIIAVIAVIISLILGTILYTSRISEGMERILRKHIKPYEQLQEFREKVWLAPEQGLLIGRVVKIDSEKIIIVNDLTGKKWEVDIENAKYPKILRPKLNAPVLITGEKTGDDTFKAETIRPQPDVGRPLRKGLMNGRQ